MTGAEVLLPYEEYPGIPVDDKASLTSLELKYLQTDPDFFVASLKSCDRLESITLYYIEWIGEFSSKIALPSLRRVKIDVYDMDTKTPAEFFKYMFFQNSAEYESEMVPENVDLDINCKAKMKKVHYNSELSQLSVYYFQYDISLNILNL